MISITSDFLIKSMLMFNELGQNIDIYIDGSNNINIENLSKGSYTLKIEMSSTTHTRKFIKN
ncbi:MAG: T9SS type A sorting domain-containing protein [Saprospiraceae bacterium]|nr:T9SS type A sorting domain-containing protein [Saprospiraceae bacterium]